MCVCMSFCICVCMSFCLYISVSVKYVVCSVSLLSVSLFGVKCAVLLCLLLMCSVQWLFVSLVSCHVDEGILTKVIFLDQFDQAAWRFSEAITPVQTTLLWRLLDHDNTGYVPNKTDQKSSTVAEDILTFYF